MSKFNIFTIDLHVILSIIVATGVYALLLKCLQKNSQNNVQANGGWGVKGFLNNVKKNALFLHDGFPYTARISFTAVLGCIEQFRALLGCSGLYLVDLGYRWLYWAVLC